MMLTRVLQISKENKKKNLCGFIFIRFFAALVQGRTKKLNGTQKET
jgi:hypothetical protein